MEYLASSVVVSSESPTATIMLRGGSSDDAEFTFHMDSNNADLVFIIYLVVQHKRM